MQNQRVREPADRRHVAPPQPDYRPDGPVKQRCPRPQDGGIWVELGQAQV